MIDISGLPGGHVVERGLRDLAMGRETVDGLVVSLAAPRLRRLGLDVPASADRTDVELALYARLGGDERPGADAYVRYNALRREHDSFLEALESRVRRGATSPVER
jgi:hypothetical protein